jgi:hypothetical protein
MKVVEDCWRSLEVTWWMAFILKEKLKALKFKLKEWSRLEFGNVEARIKKIVEDISVLDLKGEDSGLNSQEIVLRKNLFGNFKRFKKPRFFKERGLDGFAKVMLTQNSSTGV